MILMDSDLKIFVPVSFYLGFDTNWFDILVS